MTPAAVSRLGFILLLAGTILGIAGTDLVLPAVPGLPDVLGGTPARAQLVLAAFTAGGAIGLLLFGELGARLDQRRLLVASMAGYALASATAGFASSLDMLIGLRFVQGVAGAAAAVFAPGMIRLMLGPDRSVRALGLLGSIESLTPALAPIAGAWLFTAFGWRASFDALAAGAAAVAAALVLFGGSLPDARSTRPKGGYAVLLADPVFLRYALSHAATLGGLLTFVFGAPAVLTGPLGGTLGDFVRMQVTGIVFFIAAANLASRLALSFGAEPMIMAGSALSAAGAAGILVYALAGGVDPLVITALFVPVNLGLGLRGPPGFFRAVLASHGDDARGAALVILAILLAAAGGTAIAAPFITLGLVPLALVAAAISAVSVLLLLVMPRLALPAA